jgi:hypothetical protein
VPSPIKERQCALGRCPRAGYPVERSSHALIAEPLTSTECWRAMQGHCVQNAISEPAQALLKQERWRCSRACCRGRCSACGRARYMRLRTNPRMQPRMQPRMVSRMPPRMLRVMVHSGMRWVVLVCFVVWGCCYFYTCLLSFCLWCFAFWVARGSRAWANLIFARKRNSNRKTV